jgi:hypothetical protein
MSIALIVGVAGGCLLYIIGIFAYIDTSTYTCRTSLRSDGSIDCQSSHRSLDGRTARRSLIWPLLAIKSLVITVVVDIFGCLKTFFSALFSRY